VAQNEHFKVKRSKRARHSSEHRHKGDPHGHHRGERLSFISGKFNGANTYTFSAGIGGHASAGPSAGASAIDSCAGPDVGDEQPLAIVHFLHRFDGSLVAWLDPWNREVVHPHAAMFAVMRYVEPRCSMHPRLLRHGPLQRLVMDM
jgi:hypothetical protein